MKNYFVDLADEQAQSLELTGGKGSNLAKMFGRFNVPSGFVATTAFYDDFITSRNKEEIQNQPFPSEIDFDIDQNAQYAVRSSATAEDLPDSSFAGQQDSYLNIQGKENIKKAIMDCFASLFNERAVSYRKDNGFDDNSVKMAVVVQKMVDAKYAGVLFTADPVSSDRLTTVIESVEGLGEELVSGHKTPTSYRIKGGKCDKQTPFDIMELTKIGKQIESFFGKEQDIEWAFDGENFHIVQSRAITALYPLIPKTNDDKSHIYICLGHSQMMTDAMTPLGLSFFPLFVNSIIDIPSAGGRLYMDASGDMANPIGRKFFTLAMNNTDPYFKGTVEQVFKRKVFMKNIYRAKKTFSMKQDYVTPKLPFIIMKIVRKCDVDITDRLTRASENFLKETESAWAQYAGAEVVDNALTFLKDTQKYMYNPEIMASIFAGIYGQYWLKKNLRKYIDNAGDFFSQAVDNNPTTNMGLDLVDIADIVRKYPDSENIFEINEVKIALDKFLDNYGVRCTGEIDITRARFYENPEQLISIVINNVKSLEPNHRERYTGSKLAEIKAKEDEICSKLSNRKAKKLRKHIKLVRGIIGFREYPKLAMIKCFWTIKKAWLREADKLVASGKLKNREDIYFLEMGEFKDIILGADVDYDLINKRKADFKLFEKLTPPRIITSDGQIPMSAIYKKMPQGAIAGMAVSTGVIEGRARVLFKMDEAHIEPGDILVTRFTDPSWTSIFASISGLVTEVGGQMTHGSVIAREYGLPAVVSVDNATNLIKDGQKIRVNGTEGYVEILEN